jgi:hypothetical protein
LFFSFATRPTSDVPCVITIVEFIIIFLNHFCFLCVTILIVFDCEWEETKEIVYN